MIDSPATLLRQILPDEAVEAVEKERVLLERVRSLAETFEPGGPGERCRSRFGGAHDSASCQLEANPHLNTMS